MDTQRKRMEKESKDRKEEMEMRGERDGQRQTENTFSLPCAAVPGRFSAFRTMTLTRWAMI